MTEADVEGTRRRAALRGQEGVARWRIKTGIWCARLYAVVAAVPALASILWGGATVTTVVFSLVYAGVVTVLSVRIARGSRRSAIALLVMFVLDKVMAFASYGPRGLYQGSLIAVIIGFGLVQGVWGTSILRDVELQRAADAGPAPAPVDAAP